MSSDKKKPTKHFLSDNPTPVHNVQVPAYLHTKARVFVPGSTTDCQIDDPAHRHEGYVESSSTGPVATHGHALGGSDVASTSTAAAAAAATPHEKTRIERKIDAKLIEAAETLQLFQHDINYNKDSIISRSALQDALGIIVISVTKIAAGISARGGRGFVLAKLRDGKWSAPSCLSLGGVGLGLELGGERSGLVILLHSEDSVAAFARGTTNALGGNFTAAAGPRGRNIESDKVFLTGKRASVFTYSKSKGLFLGASLEWALFTDYVKGNRALYPYLHEDECVPWEILSGRVPAPLQASKLYAVLGQSTAMTGIEQWKSRVSALEPPVNTNILVPPSATGASTSAATTGFLGLGAGGVGGGKPNFPSANDSYVRYGKVDATSSTWPRPAPIHNAAGVVRISPQAVRFERDV